VDLKRPLVILAVAGSLVACGEETGVNDEVG
jgi:hypothetical protein